MFRKSLCEYDDLRRHPKGDAVSRVASKPLRVRALLRIAFIPLSSMCEYLWRRWATGTRSMMAPGLQYRVASWARREIITKSMNDAAERFDLTVAGKALVARTKSIDWLTTAIVVWPTHRR